MKVIESYGDDSIAVTMFGQKIFINAEGGQPTDWLVRSLKSASSIIDLAVKEPPIEWIDRFYFCLTKKNDLFVQPALVGHVVLTIEVPSFIVGWEAACALDARLATVSSRYAFIVGTNEQRLFRTLTSEEQDFLLPRIPGNCGAALTREKALTGAIKKWKPERGEERSPEAIYCVSGFHFKRRNRKNNVSIPFLCAIFFIIFLLCQFCSTFLINRRHAHCSSLFKPVWRASESDLYLLRHIHQRQLEMIRMISLRQHLLRFR